MDANSGQTIPVTDGLPPEQRRWAVFAIFATMAMAALDIAIANIALPAIAADLQVSPADVIWVVNVYQIALVATLLPLAALGEIIGHQRIYLGGLLLFTVASLACACAWSLPSLLIARAFQGLGAAGVMAVNTALVRHVYPTRLHGQGFGNNALVVAVSFSLGPAIASGILSVAPWPWLFAINVPVCVIAFLIGLKHLPQTPRATHRFDIIGALLTSLCLCLFILGIGSAAHRSPAWLVAAELAGAVVFGALLIRRQEGHPAPMLPVDLFRRPMFSLSVATAVCSFSVQGLAFVSLPFYFEDILHRTQVETGFFMMPWSVMVAIMAPIAGRLSDRMPVGILGGVGLLILSIGMALLAMLPVEPHVADIVWRMVICGCGFGFFQSPNMKAIMQSAPAGRSGGASGIVATGRLIGQTTGAALAALCFVLADHAGATYALALGAIFGAIGCVMSFLRLAVR